MCQHLCKYFVRLSWMSKRKLSWKYGIVAMLYSSAGWHQQVLFKVWESRINSPTRFICWSLECLLGEPKTTWKICKGEEKKQKPGLCKNQNSVMAHEFANITMKNQYKNFDLPWDFMFPSFLFINCLGEVSSFCAWNWHLNSM